jgi:hypothetical protein
VFRSVKLLPTSARRRRRLGIAAVVLALCAGVWVLSLLMPAPKHESDAPNEQGVNKVVNREHQVPLRRAERRALSQLLDVFIPAAVERKDPAAAYRLATEELRKSATRAEWRRGEIPVYPYPASKHRDWTLNFSYRNDVNVDLFVQPKKGADVGPIAFTVEFKRGRDRQWRVDSFFPTAIFPKVENGGQPLSQADLGPGNVKGTSQTGKARVSPLFFLIPPGLVVLVLLIPLVMFIRGKLREARSERIYAMSPRRTLPPLPKPREPAEQERERAEHDRSPVR